MGGLVSYGMAFLLTVTTRLAEGVFGLRAEDAFGEDVDEHKVRVRAAGDDAVTLLRQRLGRSKCAWRWRRFVRHRRRSQAQALHERLLPWRRRRASAGHPVARGRHAAIDGGCELLLTEDEAGARAAQSLVGGGGDDVGMGQRVRGGHRRRPDLQKCAISTRKEGTDFIRDGAHADESQTRREYALPPPIMSFGLTSSACLFFQLRRSRELQYPCGLYSRRCCRASRRS